jgi:hypothetical protein
MRCAKYLIKSISEDEYDDMMIKTLVFDFAKDDYEVLHQSMFDTDIGFVCK